MYLSDYKRLRGLGQTKLKKTSIYKLRYASKQRNQGSEEKPMMIVVKEYVVPIIPRPKMKKIFQYLDKIKNIKEDVCNQILSCYYNQKNEKLVVIQEYCQRGSVRQYLSTSRDPYLSTLISIANSLHELHESGVIHRNLKLQNVMMGKLDDVAIPYLVHMVQKAGIKLPQTKVLYIAPELSFSDYSRTSDVWALGIVFLQMLLGQCLSDKYDPSQMEINQYVNRKVNQIKDKQLHLVMRFLLMEEPDKRMDLPLLISLLKRIQRSQREQITKKDCLIRPVDKISLPLVNLMKMGKKELLQIGSYSSDSKIDSIDRSIGDVLLRIQYHKPKEEIRFMFHLEDVISQAIFYSIQFWNEQFYTERFQTIEDLYVYLRSCDQDQFVFTAQGFLEVIFKEERMRRENNKIERKDIEFGDMSDFPATSKQIKKMKGLMRQYYQDKPVLAKIYEKMGILYMQEGYPRSALHAFCYAEKEYETTSGSGTVYMGNLFHNLGLVCFQLGKIQKALNYLKNCLRITQKIETQLFQTANTYRVLGYIYHKERNMKSAVTCYDWALQLYKTKKIEKQMLVVLRNLSIIYIEIKDFKQAKLILEQYLQIRDFTINNREIPDVNPASVFLNYSHVLFELEDRQNGLHYCQKAMVFAAGQPNKERKDALFLAMMNQLKKEKKKDPQFIAQNDRTLHELASYADPAHIAELITFIEK